MGAAVKGWYVVINFGDDLHVAAALPRNNGRITMAYTSNEIEEAMEMAKEDANSWASRFLQYRDHPVYVVQREELDRLFVQREMLEQ